MPTEFEKRLAQGLLNEGEIANYLRAKHRACVLPAYEKEIHSGKGPRLFCPDKAIVTPDLYVFMPKRRGAFLEAKSKTVFTWHHRTAMWLTGCDLHHYNDYQEVQRQTGRDVYMGFHHSSSTPNKIDLDGRKDCQACQQSSSGTCCPPECPTGLFIARLNHLVKNEHHRHDNHGRHGMVYWEHRVFKRIPLEHVELFTKNLPRRREIARARRG